MPMQDPMSRGKRKPNGNATPLAERIAGLAAQTHGPAEPKLIYNPRELFALVETMNAASGAVLFGTTSDGGVLTVTTYLGDDKSIHYIGNREKWLEVFTALVDSEIPSQLEGGKGEVS